MRIRGAVSAEATLQSVAERLRNTGGTLHLLGLCSDGGVHSHVDHVCGLLEWAEGGEGRAAPLAQLLRFRGLDLKNSKQTLRSARVLGKAGIALGGRDLDHWILDHLLPNDPDLILRSQKDLVFSFPSQTKGTGQLRRPHFRKSITMTDISYWLMKSEPFCRDERIKRDHIHAHRFRDASDVGANFA